MRYTILAFVLILSAAMSRLIPHPPNFTPVAALALAGGVYLDKRFAFIVPLAALFISDLFLGFHQSMIYVYAGFFAIGFIGIWLRNHKKLRNIATASVTSSIIFFIITIFGVWMIPNSMYPPTFEGLITCYVAAIPFFQNSFMGDIFYTAVLFGLFELIFQLRRSIVTQKNTK
jgi:hypothetical protein